MDCYVGRVVGKVCNFSGEMKCVLRCLVLSKQGAVLYV